MNDHRVAILYQFPLVGRAIGQLLSSVDDIEIVACMPDESTAWNHILPLHPDVVIKVGEDKFASATLPPLLPKEALQLIYLETTGNEMCLCHTQHITVTSIEDLIRAVHTSDDRLEGETVGP
jgi:DNA-binding NarL/FixJ family response regulator